MVTGVSLLNKRPAFAQKIKNNISMPYKTEC